MDANTPLWKAHDLSQNLQDKIEVLPNVGRAFVHVDHETTHYPVRLPPPLLPLTTASSRSRIFPRRSIASSCSHRSPRHPPGQLLIAAEASSHTKKWPPATLSLYERVDELRAQGRNLLS